MKYMFYNTLLALRRCDNAGAQKLKPYPCFSGTNVIKHPNSIFDRCEQHHPTQFKKREL